jgi:hypothetical protein
MELTAKEILEKHWEANEGPTVTDEILAAMKEAVELAWENGYKRGKAGYSGKNNEKQKFLNSLFPESK